MSFSVSAQACITLNLAVSNMVAGQAAFVTWKTTPPPTILFSPVQVVSPTQLTLRACNVGAGSATVSSAGVRVISFG